MQRTRKITSDGTRNSSGWNDRPTWAGRPNAVDVACDTGDHGCDLHLGPPTFARGRVPITILPFWVDESLEGEVRRQTIVIGLRRLEFIDANCC